MPSSTPSRLYPFPTFSAFNVPQSFPWLYTTGAILLALLALEQTVYRVKKRHLPGDNWTIPIIGKFAVSTKPTFESYIKQWNSGVLSVISVMNMYVPFLL